MLRKLRQKAAAAIQELPVPEFWEWKRWLRLPGVSSEEFHLKKERLPKTNYFPEKLSIPEERRYRISLPSPGTINRPYFDRFLTARSTKAPQFLVDRSRSYRLFFSVVSSRVSDDLRPVFTSGQERYAWNYGIRAVTASDSIRFDLAVPETFREEIPENETLLLSVTGYSAGTTGNLTLEKLPQVKQIEFYIEAAIAGEDIISGEIPEISDNLLPASSEIFSYSAAQAEELKADDIIDTQFQTELLIPSDEYSVFTPGAIQGGYTSTQITSFSLKRAAINPAQYLADLYAPDIRAYEYSKASTAIRPVPVGQMTAGSTNGIELKFATEVLSPSLSMVSSFSTTEQLGVTEIWTPVSDAQRREYIMLLMQGQMKLHVSLESGNLLLLKPQIFTLIHQLNQVLNFPENLALSPKAEALLLRLSEIAQNNEKAIVFSQYQKSGVKRLFELLSQRDFNTKLLQGENITDELIRGINAVKGSIVLVADSKSIKRKAAFTDIRHIIHFDHWWNPLTNYQLEDRIPEAGNGRIVYYLRTYGTIEEKIYKMLKDKRLLRRSEVEKLGITAINDMIDTDDWLKLLAIK